MKNAVRKTTDTGKSPGSGHLRAPKKNAEKRVEDLEKEYVRIAKETGQLVYDFNPRTGRIRWGGAIRKITGYAPDEFDVDIKKWRAMVHPRDRGMVSRHLDTALKTAGRFTVEYRFLTKDGSCRHIKDTGIFLTDKSGKSCRMLGTITDMAKKREAQQTLAQSMSLLQATLESTADGILAVDKDGRVLTANQNFLDMWRTSFSPTPSTIDASFFESARFQLKAPEKFMRMANQGSNRLDAESFDVLEFKDGRIIEQYSKSQKVKKRIVGRVWSFRDVTKQKRAEKIKAAVYKISEIANMAETLSELFLSIHAVISELMPAHNFYIALYDPGARILSFPYFMDESDAPPAPKPLGKGLTEYVLRRGEPLLADPKKFLELERSGEVESVGAPSIDWLGVPLKVKDRTIGAMVVQTYTEGIRYTEENKAVMMFVSTQAALAIERKQAEEELRNAQRFLSNVFSSIQDGISIIDPEMNIVQVNSAIEEWYPHALPLKGKKCFKVYHGRDERCPNCPTYETFQSAKPSSGVVTKGESGRAEAGWLDLHTFPLIDSVTGKMKGVIEYARDITKRKLAEEALKASLQEKDVLLKEIHHRVKNNMQVISSLLSLQARHLKDENAIEIFKQSQNRIRSMALVHEKLYQSKDLSRIEFSKYVENLMMHLYHAYKIHSEQIEMRTEVDDIEFDINTAIPCGLIINELVTNAIKHGFPDGRKGKIRVALHPAENRRFVLTVGDNGTGMDRSWDIRKTETLGFQLVVMLVDQLDGTIELLKKPGTSFKIVFREINYKQRL